MPKNKGWRLKVALLTTKEREERTVVEGRTKMMQTSESLFLRRMAKVWSLFFGEIKILEYGQVTKMLGNGRVEALCIDGNTRICHIRGKLRKKVRLWKFLLTNEVWINQGDIILIGLRDYQDDKADVILKYSADEARSLRTYKELPEHGTSLCLQTAHTQSKSTRRSRLARRAARTLCSMTLRARATMMTRMMMMWVQLSYLF